MLPRDVQRVVKPSGRVYYYYAPRRGTAGAGKRIPLGIDTADPEFWRLLRDAITPPAARDGTLSKLIAEYRAHKEFDDLRPESKRVYTHFLDRLQASGGERPVSAMTRRDIYSLLDQMSSTPVAANLMLTVLRTLLEFGVPRGYRDDNPAIGIKKLKIEDSGHSPWPEQGYVYVMEHAPTHLRRLAFLGRATGQRVSDLVKMRPADLADDGINVRIGKLRDKPHFVPLTAAQMMEIRSWGVRDLEFFISIQGSGKRYTTNALNKSWNKWRGEAAPIRDLKMTIHGLRATAIHDRRSTGTEDGAIATKSECRSRWCRAISGSQTRRHQLAPAVIAVNERWPNLKTLAGFENFRPVSICIYVTFSSDCKRAVNVTTPASPVINKTSPQSRAKMPV
jgi:integrase